MAGEMDAAIAAMETQVSRNGTVDGSAGDLIRLIAAKFVEFKDAPAKIVAYAAALGVSTDALEAAVIANTPAADLPPA